VKCPPFPASGLASVPLGLAVLFGARRPLSADSPLSLRRPSYKYRPPSLFFHLSFILPFQHSVSPLQCRSLYPPHSPAVLTDWSAPAWGIFIYPPFLHSLPHHCTPCPPTPVPHPEPTAPSCLLIRCPRLSWDRCRRMIPFGRELNPPRSTLPVWERPIPAPLRRPHFISTQLTPRLAVALVRSVRL